MLDGMKIKKMMEYDPISSKFTGFVDLGEEHSTESEDLATEALMFMVVGLRGHWKQILGYFLITGISADMQTQLVLHAISALREIGIFVRALTADGHATNLSMFRKLGCSTDANQLQSHFFTADGDKVCCFLDACHCLKLVRNSFATVEEIEVESLGSAKWSHVVALNDIQQQEGLVAANRLSDRHVHYEQQKMKVSKGPYCLQQGHMLSLFVLVSKDYLKIN